LVDRLSRELESLVDTHMQRLTTARPEYRRLDKYYEGLNRLSQLQLAIPPELEQFVVFVNWCRKAVDSVEHRLNLIGFQLPGTSKIDESLQETWDYNNMGADVTMAFLDALSLSAGYIAVGANEEDPEHPLITVESPDEITHIRDTRTRKLSSAFRSYAPVNGIDQSATLYLPNETFWLERDGNMRWYIGDYDQHNLGRVPVVPLINRPRSHQLPNWKIPGVSQMHDVIPIVDAAARALTNAQVAQEVIATPQRGIIGATKGDFVDESGQPLPMWEAYFGSVWAVSNPAARSFEFSAGDMKNFETIVNLYARQASGVTGLPPNYFGLVSDDAASDAAIRSRETQLVKLSERQIANLSNDIKSVGQIVDRFKTGDWNPDLRKLTPVWLDAGTPTKGQATDAAVKLYEGDILDRESTWEELNYSPAKIEILKKRFEERDKLQLAQAQQIGVNGLLDEVGLDENGEPRADAGDTRTGSLQPTP